MPSASDPTAGLAAEAGVAVFTSAFHSWVQETEQRGFAQLVRASLVALRAVAVGG